MSATLVQESEYNGTAATSTVTLTGVTTGNTLYVTIEEFDASAFISLSDDKGNFHEIDLSERNQLNNGNVRFYRANNVTGGTVILTVEKANVLTHRWYVEEVSGVANAAPEVTMTRATGGYNTTAAINFTPASANAYARIYASYGAGRIATQDATDFIPLDTSGNRGGMGAYKADNGAVGAKTASLTLSSGANWAVSGLVYAAGAAGPTVTSVTAGSVTEAGARNVVVALSAATTATTAIPCSLAGSGADAASGADLTLSLNGVACTNGVTCDGTNFSVPSGVSGWSFDVQTTADALDEANETATITIGGQTATITITDDDPLPYITGTAVVTVNRGESVVIAVTLDAASGRVTGGRFTLTDGTKVGGTDYTNVITNDMISNGVTISAGVLSIPAGVVSFTITIPTAA